MPCIVLEMHIADFTNLVSLTEFFSGTAVLHTIGHDLGARIQGRVKSFFDLMASHGFVRKRHGERIFHYPMQGACDPLS